jgi:hypothetical protein
MQVKGGLLGKLKGSNKREEEGGIRKNTKAGEYE